jgi:hypothetical protein
MNYIGTIGEKEVKVGVREVGVARYVVTIDGQEHQVDAHQVQSSVWSVLYGDASFEVDVLGKNEEFEVLIAGDCYKFTLMNSRPAGRGREGAAMVVICRCWLPRLGTRAVR